MTGALASLPGSAVGRLAGRSPGARLASGAVAFAACMVAPAGSALGAVYLLATAAAWVGLCGLPARAAVRLAAVVASVLLPLGLIALAAGPDDAGLARVAAGMGALAIRGIAATLVAVATAATLAPGQLEDGLAALRVPVPAAAILVQIVRQAGLLARETASMAAAIRVRGGAHGLRSALVVAAALPRAWLPRVADRARRAEQAMELRGFDGSTPFAATTWSRADASLLAATGAWAAAGIGLRAWGG